MAHTNILSSVTVKSMLGIPAGITRYDSAITITLEVSEQILLDEIGLSDFVSKSYSEKIDITESGLNEVALAWNPVISIAALTIKSTAQTITTDYEINKELGIIKLVPLSAYFPTGRGSVEVSYTAGYADVASIPKDLSYAGHLICCSMFNQQSHVGFVSEKAGNYSYNLGKATGSTIPMTAQRILNKHRRLFARGMRIQ